MSSLLESQVRAAIAKGFKGKLLEGTITRTTSTTVDQYGDPVPGSTITAACEGFPDEYDDVYRKQAGIPETSVKIILIAGNTAVEPKKTDIVTFRGIDYEILKVKTDPALAHYECESYRVN